MKKSIFIIFCFCMLFGLDRKSTEQNEAPASPGVSTVLMKLSVGILSEKDYKHAVKEIEDDGLQKTLAKFEVASLRSVF